MVGVEAHMDVAEVVEVDAVVRRSEGHQVAVHGRELDTAHVRLAVDACHRTLHPPTARDVSMVQ